MIEVMEPRNAAERAAVAWGGRGNPYRDEFVRGFDDAVALAPDTPSTDPAAAMAYTAGRAAGAGGL